jgi:hypothetical protein
MSKTRLEPAYTAYPNSILVGLALRILYSSLLGQKRSFRQDASRIMRRIVPSIRALAPENIPTKGPCLLTFNHFYRPGMKGFWLAMGLASLVPADIQWIMAAAWTYRGQKRGIIMRPLVRWYIGCIAGVYDFIRMPPVPPVPEDAQERALAVRRVVQYVRQAENPLIGLAPEGGDMPGGRLGWPPPGAGRFILQLNRLGLPIVPIGIFEQDGAMCFRFGLPYRLLTPAGLSSDEQDKQVIRQVMGAIATQLPHDMWGEFTPLPLA